MIATSPKHTGPADRLFKVLVIEDNPTDQFLIREFLSREGFPNEMVLSAHTLAEALECLSSFAPDVAVLDLFLPDGRGVETINQFRACAGRTPIVVLSATEDEETAIQAVRCGAQDYLVKGQVERALLIRSLRYAIERNHLQTLSEQILVENEKRFRTLADATPVLIWAMGGDKSCNYFNRQWLEFRGRTLEQEQGTGWTEGLHPEDSDKLLETCSRSFQARHPFRVEYRMRRVDGAYRWLLDTGAPHFSPDGQFMGFVGSCIDITDRRDLESQLVKVQKMEAVGRLAGGIAHDFNNSLMVIHGYGELMLMGLPEQDRLRASVQEILKAADHAAKLTQQLLAFSRQQVIEPRLLQLNDVVAEVEKMLRHAIGADVELVIDVAPQLARIKADSAQLAQAIVNLAINAREAMPHGGKLTIRASNTETGSELSTAHSDVPPGRYVCLEVRDTGIGMDQTTRERIFEPFFTTKEFGKGTGMGLATVYGIVKQNGGHIRIASAPGTGTTFSLYLPQCEEETTIAEKPAERAPQKPVAATILVVEDEPAVRHVTCRFLRMAGYHVLEACEGSEALQLAGNFQDAIQLLITDVVMPRMGGLEIATKLRELRPETRVLFVSGYSPGVVLRQGIIEGNQSLLQKPFGRDDLLDRVRIALDAPAQAKSPA